VKARDVMTSAVVSVGPDTPIREIAQTLRDHGISAVPVLDAAGAASGMVSEGDLISRDDAGREARRDWWLTLLAEGEPLDAEFVENLRAPERTARDVMANPVVTVGEDTEISEVARLLTTHRIKRVPVLRGGRIIGIVSRADLVRAFAAEEPKSTAVNGSGSLAGAFAGLDRRFFHISDENWRALLHQARQSAEQGEKEFMLMRFPSQLCSDGARAINISETGWPDTLRGEAAELYLRWERDLKPHGFPLGARLLDFPGGMPGDVGLFLFWGQ
jgi:CBS domain-containing protein